jgi:hypothetical protein
MVQLRPPAFSANYTQGCLTEGNQQSSNNSFIYNNIANCTAGLFLLPGDKYQGNVTIKCATPFLEGIAVGQENN